MAGGRRGFAEGRSARSWEHSWTAACKSGAARPLLAEYAVMADEATELASDQCLRQTVVISNPPSVGVELPVIPGEVGSTRHFWLVPWIVHKSMQSVQCMQSMSSMYLQAILASVTVYESIMGQRRRVHWSVPMRPLPWHFCNAVRRCPAF